MELRYLHSLSTFLCTILFFVQSMSGMHSSVRLRSAVVDASGVCVFYTLSGRDTWHHEESYPFTIANANMLLSDGSRPLHYAVRLNGYENDDAVTVVQQLLMHDAQVNQTDSHGRTPLHCAVSVRNYANNTRQVTTLLMDAGANPLVRDANGRTALNTLCPGHPARDFLIEQMRDRYLLNRSGPTDVNNYLYRIPADVRLMLADFVCDGQ